jgi:hypothetical protein
LKRPRGVQVAEGAFFFRRTCHPQPHGIAASGSAHRLPGAKPGNRLITEIGFKSHTTSTVLARTLVQPRRSLRSSSKDAPPAAERWPLPWIRFVNQQPNTSP